MARRPRAGLAAAALLALTLLPDPARGCRRRVRDVLPDSGPRNAFERGLLEITADLEACFERMGGQAPERRARARAALERWPEFAAAHADEAPETVTVPPEQYRLVMGSLGDYVARIQAAWDRGDEAEARRQEIALQHAVGELYQVNPGRISRAGMVAYTAVTLDHLPEPSPASRAEWERRVRLLELRTDEWLESFGRPEMETLGAVRALRSGVAQLSRELAVRTVEEPVEEAPDEAEDEEPNGPSAEGAAPLDPTIRGLQHVARLAVGAVTRAGWSRGKIPDSLRAVPEVPGLAAPPSSTSTR